MEVRRFWSVPHVERRGGELALLIALAALLELAAGVGLAYVAGFSQVRAVVGDVHWGWLVVLAGALVVSFAGYRLAYQGIFRVEGGPKLPRRQMHAVVAAGFGGLLAHGYHEMPFVFAGSAATAAAGLGLLAAPPDQNAPARNLGLLGACLELTASHRMMSRIGIVAEPYHEGRGGAYIKAGEALTILGAIGSLAARRNRIVGALSGAALLAASAATRWGVFHVGLASADDPKYTVVPQRERLRRRSPARAGAVPR